MQAKGQLSNVRVFEGKGGKKFYSADFISLNPEFSAKLVGPELAGLTADQNVAVDIAGMSLKSFEFKGCVGVGLEIRCKTIKAEGA